MRSVCAPQPGHQSSLSKLMCSSTGKVSGIDVSRWHRVQRKPMSTTWCAKPSAALAVCTFSCLSRSAMLSAGMKLLIAHLPHLHQQQVSLAAPAAVEAPLLYPRRGGVLRRPRVRLGILPAVLALEVTGQHAVDAECDLGGERRGDDVIHRSPLSPVR